MSSCSHRLPWRAWWTRLRPKTNACRSSPARTRRWITSPPFFNYESTRMNSTWWQPFAVSAALALAIGLRFIPKLRGYQFTAWIIAAVTAAMIFPQAFSKWGDFDLQNKWVKLLVVQTVMFGMGTQMSLHDFAGVVKNPRGVLVGIVCHFSVMPLIGFALTKTFHFEPEIAAGIILIGSCSSGLASNVMAYIAKSNLALSVTVTAMTTVD